MKKRLHPILSVSLSAAMAFGAMMPAVTFAQGIQATGELVSSIDLTSYGPNLALGQPTNQSTSETNNFKADKAVDGDMNTHWGCQQGNHDGQWINVDLGSVQEIGLVRVCWESTKATAWKVQLSNDGTNYTDVYEQTSWPAGKTDKNDAIVLEAGTKARYVAVYISEYQSSEHVSTGIGVWDTVAINELEVYGAPDPDRLTRGQNLVYKSEMSADSQLQASPAGLAADIDSSTAWVSAANGNQHWIQSDFGENRKVNTIQVEWGRKNAKKWSLQYASMPESGQMPDLESDDSWTTIQSFTSVPQNDLMQISLPEEISARWLRLVVDETAPGGLLDLVCTLSGSANPAEYAAKTWTAFASGLAQGLEKLSEQLDEQADEEAARELNRLWMDLRLLPSSDALKALSEGTAASSAKTGASVSVAELKAYGATSSEATTLAGYLSQIAVFAPEKGDDKLQVFMPVSDKYTGTFSGADLEQIVGYDYSITAPLQDKTVALAFKAEDASGNYDFREIEVVIPGLYEASETDNQAPAVLPELQEWKGRESGSFTLNANTVVYTTDEMFADAAGELVLDYADMSGTELKVESADSAQAVKAGSIVFEKSSDTSLGKEGYWMDVEDDKIVIQAVHSTGAYWATRTLLQAVMADDAGAIPAGTMRDYPLYSVRGVILDVGRKTFTIDFLEQMSKFMSWYKLNDFQVHLNDNYIWIEEYGNVDGEDKRMECYSGFRLESDIKEGGNNGLNQADLTSTDVFYTKDEFRTFIQDSRRRGLNIVPEFDTPAHSLALTKVRPDLAQPGNSHREADHLNLQGKLAECVEFVSSIFDEYTEGDNPVFDEDVVIHIGADEYEADGTAYRKFVNEMFEHVEEGGRVGRVWGSLLRLTSNTVDVDGTYVKEDGTIGHRQMNIWSVDWALPRTGYDRGFELITCLDSLNYIVPNANYYYDYLPDSTVYTSSVNTVSGQTIPAGDPLMAGGAFAVWNDMCGARDNGVSEYDVYKRMAQAMGLHGAKMWGAQEASLSEAQARRDRLNDVPNTNFDYEVETAANGTIVSLDMESTADASGLGHDLIIDENSALESVDGSKALKLSASSKASIEGLETVGLNSSLKFRVKRTSSSTDEQVLFASEYGTFKAVQTGTGKVGFSRENRDYSFDYTLPVNQWVELEIRNTFEKTSLYVNGTLVSTLGSSSRAQEKATFMLPLAAIGNGQNTFEGYLDDVVVKKLS